MVLLCSHEGSGQGNVLLPGHILYGRPRGPKIGGPKMGLFSWRHTWIILFAINPVYIGVHKNTNASNFSLYGGPDSRPKGPHQNGFIQLNTYMGNSFCNGICILWGSQKYQCQQLYPVRGPRQQPQRAQTSHNWFIQLKTYMDNSFCNGIGIHWGSQK